MLRTDLWSVVDCLAAARFAGVYSGCYLGWLIVFERWLEPLLRRCGGAILGSSVVWVSTGGSFRIWGIRDRPGSTDATLGLLGSGAVLCAAVLPLILLQFTVTPPDGDAAIAASSYLMSLPMMGVFVLRLLWGKRGTQ